MVLDRLEPHTQTVIQIFDLRYNRSIWKMRLIFLLLYAIALTIIVDQNIRDDYLIDLILNETAILRLIDGLVNRHIRTY